MLLQVLEQISTLQPVDAPKQMSRRVFSEGSVALKNPQWSSLERQQLMEEPILEHGKASVAAERNCSYHMLPPLCAAQGKGGR